MRDFWDPTNAWRDPLSGRRLTRPVGQRVCVKNHPFNGVIVGIVNSRIRDPATGRREPPGAKYQVEHDNGEILRWPWHAVSNECPLEALGKMGGP